MLITHEINKEIMQLVFFQREDHYLPLCAQSWSILEMAGKQFATDEDLRILNMNFGIFVYFKNNFRSSDLRYDYLSPTSTKGWRNAGYRQADMNRRLEKLLRKEKK